MTLTVQDLTLRRGDCPVVDHVSFAASPGEMIGLIGPNGAGKTTLLRTVLGLERASDGNSSLAALPTEQRAKTCAWLPQTRQVAWPVTVEVLVALGRLPHLPRGQRLAPADQRAVDQALDRMGLTTLRHRPATELSGGEQARALIARALAQDTQSLLADEPIAGLDPAAQLSTLEVFRDLAAQGRTVIVSLHDLSLAARFCTRLLLMHRGRLVADGAPDTVLTTDRLAQVFQLRARVLNTGTGLLIEPLGVIV